MKRILTPTAALITAALLLCSCGNNPVTSETMASETAAATTTTSEATTAATTTTLSETPAQTETEATVNTNAKTTVIDQLYEEDVKLEILSLTYDGDKKPGADAVNADIKELLQPTVENYFADLEANSDNPDYFSGLEIYGYSITDENFIQIYQTVFTYPTYGTAPTLYGYIYDVPNDQVFKPEDFYLSEGYASEDEIFAEIKAKYEADFTNVDRLESKGLNTVYLTSDPNGGNYQVSYFFTAKVYADGNEEPWEALLLYSPKTGEIVDCNPDCILPADVFDEYDPPFHYQDNFPHNDGPAIP
jgi:hypothetical protein